MHDRREGRKDKWVIREAERVVQAHFERIHKS